LDRSSNVAMVIGNQLHFGANSENWQVRPSFFALEFHKELECCNVDGYIKNYDDLSAQFKNLVKFTPITSEIARLECVQKASISIPALD